MMTTPDFDNTAKAFAYKNNGILLRDYALFRLMNFQWLVSSGTAVAAKALDLGFDKLIALGMKPTIYSVFCGGESLEKATLVIEKMHSLGVQSILDYGVEASEEEADFEKTAAEIHRAIDYAAVHSAVKIVCSKFTGLLNFPILEKLNEGIALSADEKSAYERSVARIEAICQHAYEKDISLFVDAEESWIQKPLDELTLGLMRKFNREKPIVYNTIQLYLKSRLGYLKEAQSIAKNEGFVYAAKLVRGAYMDKEAKRAKQLKYPNPIQDSKTATDQDYNEAVKFAFEHLESTAICVATHNEESNQLAIALMQKNEIAPNHPHVHFSQLLGMSDNITFNLAAAGYNASKYMPYGPVKEVIPYLIRRAQENTSVAGQMGRELQLLQEEVKRRKLFFGI
jgi:proline dehydrogenase